MNIGTLKRKIFKSIKSHDEIVIARHIGPDPDAIASTTALKESIKATFKNKKVYAVGKGISRFKYFGELDKVDEDKLKNPLLIVLDVPNISRIDGIDFKKYKDIIKIDHHPFEDKMGNIEWIDDKASSVCQMIAELIFDTNLKLPKKTAENLFMGIVSDSERFSLSYTSAKTFLLVSKLLEYSKIDIISLYNNLYMRPFSEIRFQGFIATHLNVTENNFAYLKISKEDILEYGVDISTPSNLVNNFNYIKEILAWALVIYDEKNELFKVNIRSRGPIINQVASKHNGGGHPLASGARIKNEADVNNLFAELDEECKKYNENRKI